MDTKDLNFDYREKMIGLKDSLLNSKKYWIIYILFLVIFCLSRFTMGNYLNPKLEIAAFIILALAGIFCIAYYNSNNKEIYKTTFIVILIFGIICSFITPICLVPDEVEHFSRSDLTSNGDFLPNYQNGSYMISQSVIDLTKVGLNHLKNGGDLMHTENSTIFDTDADTKPINNTLVPYPSAFAQNPFFGYLAPGLGILIAKLLDLNAIWMLWLGRIFNVLLYASLAAYAVKKTPILKVPFFVMVCIPSVIFSGASVSIDAFINGIGFVTIAYFFHLYKSPENSLNVENLVKFSLLVLLIGMCKVTCFAFIFLLLFIPKKNFEQDKYYYYGFICVVLLGIVALLWSKYYANPGFFKSFRTQKWAVYDVNSTQQISYILSHKTQSIIELLHLPNYFTDDLTFRWVHYNSIYLLFFGAVCLMYPHPRFNIKTRLGALLVSAMIYVGTYIVLLLTWTPVGNITEIAGVQQRYFFTIFPLIPFIFGFNHMDGDTTELDFYIVVISLAFLAFLLLHLILELY